MGKEEADKMDDLKNRFNPRSEEEGLKLEAEAAAKKAAASEASDSGEESAEVDATPAPSKADNDLAGMVSVLDIKKTSENSEKSDKAPADGTDSTEKADSNLIQSNYEVKVKLADLQADPNSPLYSVKSFEDLGL